MSHKFLAVALSLSILQPAYAAQSAFEQLGGLAGVEAPEGGLPPAAAELRASVEKAAAERPLFELTEKIEGGKTRRFIVVHLAQMDKLFLLNSTIVEGPADGGVMPAMDETLLVAFRLSGDRVLFVEKQTDFRADEGTPERKAIDSSTSEKPAWLRRGERKRVSMSALTCRNRRPRRRVPRRP